MDGLPKIFETSLIISKHCVVASLSRLQSTLCTRIKTLEFPICQHFLSSSCPFLILIIFSSFQANVVLELEAGWFKLNCKFIFGLDQSSTRKIILRDYRPDFSPHLSCKMRNDRLLRHLPPFITQNKHTWIPSLAMNPRWRSCDCGVY